MDKIKLKKLKRVWGGIALLSSFVASALLCGFGIHHSVASFFMILMCVIAGASIAYICILCWEENLEKRAKVEHTPIYFGAFLKGLLNGIIKLCLLYVSIVFAWNVLAAGGIFFPYLVGEVDMFLSSHSGWWLSFVPGLLPVFFLVGVLCLAVWIISKTLSLLVGTDIVGIISKVLSPKKEVK